MPTVEKLYQEGANADWPTLPIAVRLPQHPQEALHNHETDDPANVSYAAVELVYDGFSRNHLYLHVWRCVAKPERGALVPVKGEHNQPDFGPPLCHECIAGPRLCTFRRYCGDTPAAFTTEDGRLAFCEHHARKYQMGPCPYTRTFFCVERSRLDAGLKEPRKCSVCRRVA